MKFQFFGATETVTGSKTLLSVGNEKYLIDCGQFQGLKHFREKNWNTLPFRAAEISAVFLTHAHIDHSGLLPLLVKQGFSGPIYCTHATRQLCEILLLDSAHLQEEDADYANRKGFSKHSPALPLFTTYDVTKTMRYFKCVDFDQVTKVGKLAVTFHPAGHILGAAWLSILNEGKHICFSGDLGRTDDSLMNPPKPLVRADVLVCESTYGDRLHPQEASDEKLADIINDTTRRGGTVVIPSFAVGRAQLLLQMIVRLIKNKKIPSLPIYLDSPMATRATALFSEHLGEHKLSARDLADFKNLVTFVESAEASKRVTLDKEPKIIVSASGMATGGRILHHLKTFLPSGRNSVVIVGYQAVGTRGASLANHAEAVKIHGAYVPVNAGIHKLDGLSAHADQTGLLNWIEHLNVPPRQVFLNHGEPEACEGLRIALRDRFQIEAVVPEFGDEIELK